MPARPASSTRRLWTVLAGFALATGVGAEELPLHQRIDALVAATWGEARPSPQADDAELLRRLWLDFDGGIPSAEQTRAFLADTSPGKRAALVEKLLSSPRFATRMADAFDVMLMERRGENAAWREWLTASFQANKPWDAMVREILAPDFQDEKLRGAGWFITRRLEKVGQQDTDYPGLTRDVGRMFMGVDLQCCQCHRHLTVDDYKQADFNGLFTVYQNLKLQPADAKIKVPWVSEGVVAARYEFASVLTGAKGQTGPRVPFTTEVAIPAYTGDEAWLVKPDRKTKELGKPKFSPLQEIAQRLPAPENAFFARNAVNRVWFLMMGSGLVEPLDFIHSENPASHPELLDLLAKEFAAHRFDLRWLIRELALTEVYARSSALPREAAPKAGAERTYTTARERHLTAAQMTRTFLLATGELERVSTVTKAEPEKDEKKYTLADFEKAFVAALANAPKEPELQVNPTLRSSLFLRNGDHVLWAVKPRAGNLVDRVLKLPTPEAMAEELYLSILTRMPDTDEKALFAEWMERPGVEKSLAVGDFVWALLSSTEWFVNH
ncbi:uncharacterized protein DUF1553 [Roseimicrobium gellanilyticum]|uniref:Uncharacterized protein DUF1553 n=1 Tax=Roseimicrobium gellanilyticum TaxID=748857 RepID=A0A366HTG5_9BACT|nr:DUF1549 domain-containing protein [Roseimicrobium gellanilyticum]RBP47377.1 uncharacterized protein DUF1553 [Roseimicrobium gellanilyticum]